MRLLDTKIQFENMLKEYIYTDFEDIVSLKELQNDLYSSTSLVQDIEIVSEKNVWDKSVKSEENGYYWHGTPHFLKGKNLHTDKKVVVEFFCGCGGTSLGFEMAEFEVILGVDIHQPSIKTFRSNHPNCSTILGDIKKINPTEILNFLEK